MPLPFIVFVSCIGLYFLIRLYWYLRCSWAFAFLMATYVQLSKTDFEELKPYCKLYSLTYILFDLTNWDFTKYIIHKEKYIEVCLFHIEVAKKLLNEAEEKTKLAAQENQKK